MELNDYKELWRASERRNAELEAENREMMSRIKRGEVTTSIDRLARYYRKFMWCGVSLLLMVMMFPILKRGGMITSVLWPMIFASAEAIMGIAVDGYLYREIRSWNMNKLGVVELSSQAARCRRIHLIAQGVMLVMAIGFVVSFGFAMTDPFFVGGMVVGGLIGGAIGLSSWLKMMRIYKDLINDGQDIVAEVETVNRF